MFSLGRPWRPSAPQQAAMPPKPTPVNNAMFSMAQKPARLDFSPALADGNPTGGQGFGGGMPAQSWGTAQEFQNANFGPAPAGNGGGGLSSFLPDTKSMISMGIGASGVPFGNAMFNAGQIGWKLANGDPVTARDKANLGFSLIGGPVGGLKGIADAYSKTDYARNHPYSSYAFGGNADQEAAKYADSSFRSGFSPQQSATLYDAITAQKNLGGAGDIQKAIDDWRMANFNDGKIHIGEAGLQNPYSVDMPGTIDNSGAGVTFAPQAGPDTGMPDASQSGGGNEPGGYIDMGDGSQTIDNSGVGVSGDGNGGIDWGFAKGGIVRRPMPGMADPPGPDDQYAPVKSGEGVLTREAMQRIGAQRFSELLAGKAKVVRR